MHIDHIAIWTGQLERMKDFYAKCFQAKAGDKYNNPETHFESYFLSFASGARLELMYKPGIAKRETKSNQADVGYAHISFAVGSEDEVDQFSARMLKDRYPLLDGPRRTGDGYYECVLLDPDGNMIEITA